MIIILFLNLIVSVLGALFYVLPSVEKLPFGIDEVIVQGAGYLSFLGDLIPPLGYLVSAFVFYIGFLMLLKVMKLVPIIRNMFD